MPSESTNTSEPVEHVPAFDPLQFIRDPLPTPSDQPIHRSLPVAYPSTLTPSTRFCQLYRYMPLDMLVGVALTELKRPDDIPAERGNEPRLTQALFKLLPMVLDRVTLWNQRPFMMGYETHGSISHLKVRDGTPYVDTAAFQAVSYSVCDFVSHADDAPGVSASLRRPENPTSAASSGVGASTSHVSSTSGIRCPAGSLRLVWITTEDSGPVTYSTAIEMREHKPPTGPARYRQGIAQNIMYLATTRQMVGTYLGMNHYGSWFQRLMVIAPSSQSEIRIAVELAPSAMSDIPNRPFTARQLLDLQLEKKLPWNLLRAGEWHTQSLAVHQRYTEHVFKIGYMMKLEDVSRKLRAPWESHPELALDGFPVGNHLELPLATPEDYHPFVHELRKTSDSASSISGQSSNKRSSHTDDKDGGQGGGVTKSHKPQRPNTARKQPGRPSELRSDEAKEKGKKKAVQSTDKHEFLL